MWKLPRGPNIGKSLCARASEPTRSAAGKATDGETASHASRNGDVSSPSFVAASPLPSYGCGTESPTAPILEPVRASFRDNTPLQWTRVHDLPDFVYFNHSIHVNKGVGCASCHGRVDTMPAIYQAASLQMEWCLACHREPERYLRPKDQITNMGWNLDADPADGVTANSENRLGENLAQSRRELGLRLKREYRVRDAATLTSCSTCHR